MALLDIPMPDIGPARLLDRRPFAALAFRCSDG